MVWDTNGAKALDALAGVYALPGNCWAILTVNNAPPIDASTLAACPEGYVYTWAILAPGKPPNLRGHRMAGIDNSDDKHVRDQIKANPQRGKHRAHKRQTNWKEIASVRGRDWPTAGQGMQLPAPPASPADFWILCMDCLSQTLGELGLDVPEETQLFENRMTEDVFRKMQRDLTGG